MSRYDPGCNEAFRTVTASLPQILQAQSRGNHDLSLIFRDILDGVMGLSCVVSDSYFYVILLIFVFMHPIISSSFQLTNVDLLSPEALNSNTENNVTSRYKETNKLILNYLGVFLQNITHHYR
jgi:hypothetical protein